MTFVTSFLIGKQRWRVFLVSQQELQDILSVSAASKPEGACAYKPECSIFLRSGPSLDTIIHEVTHAFWFHFSPKYRRLKDHHEQVAWFFGKHGNRIVKIAHKVRHEISA